MTYLPTDLLPIPKQDIGRDSRLPYPHRWVCALMEGRYATAELMSAYLPTFEDTSRNSSASSGTNIPTMLSGEC